MIEKVNPDHPDKVADRIAGAIVDLGYKIQENPKIAVEVLIGHGNCKIIIERHSSNPFLGFLKLYCDSYCEQDGIKVRMWRYFKLWRKKK